MNQYAVNKFNSSLPGIKQEILHELKANFILLRNLKNEFMKIIAIDQVEKKKVRMEGAAGAWKQLPLGTGDGVPVYSLRVFTVEPGGNTPYHSHPYEHMNFIIEGQGVLVNEAGEEKPLKKGDFALVNPNEKHQYRNNSTVEVFRMICGVPKEFE
jgi:quercetin dioxygenase-like cupin family protein